MKFFKLIFFLFFINIVVLADEVSVFGAGDLESSDPYGLTSSEKVILKNKKSLKKFDNKVKKFDNKVDNIKLNVDSVRSNIDLLSERIDGIESIVDGDSRKLNKTVLKLNKILKNVELQIEKSEEIEKSSLANSDNILKQANDIRDIKELQSIFEEHSKIQNENIKLLQKSVENLTVLLNNINKDYVTKKQFDELVVFINKQNVKNSKKNIKKEEKKFKKTNKELIEEARKLFKNDYFDKAIPIFEYLVSKNYRPAESNFYLGEIWFYRKKYKDAIHCFKTSMMLYDKAKYIPRLLLHSAVSFEKINDLDNAANFYGTLIDAYPDTKEAQEAQKNLSSVN